MQEKNSAAGREGVSRGRHDESVNFPARLFVIIEIGFLSQLPALLREDNGDKT